MNHIEFKSSINLLLTIKRSCFFRFFSKVDFLYRVSWIWHFMSLMILRVLNVHDADKCIVLAVGNAIGVVSVIVGLDVVPPAISAAGVRGAIGQDDVDVAFAGAIVVGLVTVPVSVSELGLVVHVVECAY